MFLLIGVHIHFPKKVMIFEKKTFHILTMFLADIYNCFADVHEFPKQKNKESLKELSLQGIRPVKEALWRFDDRRDAREYSLQENWQTFSWMRS